MMRRPFDHRILCYIYELGRDLRARLSEEQSLAGELTLSTSSESLWDYAENSPRDVLNDSNSQGDKDSKSGDGGDPPENRSNDSDDEVDECVIIYVRVSSNEQKREGQSIDSQVDELKSIVESNPNRRLFGPPIRDEGETGTDFDREGIQRVAELAQSEEVTHVYVDSIDRIGRSVAETILFIEYLRNECDVKIRTRSREFDVVKPADKFQITTLAAMADFGTNNRAYSARRSKADNFLQKKIWNSWYQNFVPFGYELDDAEEENWIQPISELRVVVQDIYNEFLNRESYSEVADVINQRHRTVLNRYCVDDDEVVDEVLTRQKIKAILTRAVYKGEPTVPVTSLSHYEPYPSVDDPELSLVSEETFEEVQEIVTGLEKKYGSEEDVTFTPSGFAEEFDPFAVDTVSQLVQLHCPKCEGELVSNGQYRVDNQHASRMYQCSNEECDYQRRWPKQSELEMMKLIKKLDEVHSIL